MTILGTNIRSYFSWLACSTESVQHEFGQVPWPWWQADSVGPTAYVPTSRQSMSMDAIFRHPAVQVSQGRGWLGYYTHSPREVGVHVERKEAGVYHINLYCYSVPGAPNLFFCSRGLRWMFSTGSRKVAIGSMPYTEDHPHAICLSSQKEPRLQLVKLASCQPCYWQDFNFKALYLLLPRSPLHYNGENIVSIPCFTEHMFYIDWKVNFWTAHSVFPLCIPKSEISSKVARGWIENLQLKKY